MEKVSTLIKENNDIEEYCINKYLDILVNDGEPFDELLSHEILVHHKKLLKINQIMELLRNYNEIVDCECIYVCSYDEVPHDAIYKGYSAICEKCPGVVTYFRVIFKDKSNNNFYIADSYSFVPMN